MSDIDPRNSTDDVKNGARAAEKTARAAKKAYETAKKVAKEIRQKGFKGAAKGAAKKIAAKASGCCCGVVGKAILILVLVGMLLTLLGELMSGPTVHNTTSGAGQEAQNNDFTSDDDYGGEFKETAEENEIDEPPEHYYTKYTDTGDKEKNKAEYQQEHYNPDMQYKVLMSIMLSQQEDGYKEAMKKYALAYLEERKNPHNHTHDDVSEVYQDPRTGKFYRQGIEVVHTNPDGSTWSEWFFKDEVNPRGVQWREIDKLRDVLKNANEEERKIVEQYMAEAVESLKSTSDSVAIQKFQEFMSRAFVGKIPASGITYTIGAYTVSRCETAPGVDIDGNEDYAFFKYFKDLIGEFKVDTVQTDTKLSKERKSKQVLVHRFRPAQDVAEDRTTTKLVPVDSQVQTFDYEEAFVTGTVKAYDIRRIIEKLFADSPFYEDVRATYVPNGENITVSSDDMQYASGSTENVVAVLNRVKKSWPKNMDPRRIDVVLQGLRGIERGMRYIYGAGHGSGDNSFKNPNIRFVDCSGFVAWAFYQAPNCPFKPKMAHRAHLFGKEEGMIPITHKDLLPGDIVSRSTYTDKNGQEQPGGHVGIFIGWDEKGKPMVVHSCGGYDNTSAEKAGRGPATVGFGKVSMWHRAKEFKDNQTWEGYRGLTAENVVEKKGNTPIADLLKASTSGFNDQVRDAQEDEKGPATKGKDPVEDNLKFGAYKTYDKLTEADLRAVAQLAVAELGCDKESVYNAISIMVNKFEKYGSAYGNDEKAFMAYVNNGEFGIKLAGSFENAVTLDEAYDIARQVLVQGRRTLPRYVTFQFVEGDVDAQNKDGVQVTPEWANLKKDDTVLLVKGKPVYFFKRSGLAQVLYGYEDRAERDKNHDAVYQPGQENQNDVRQSQAEGTTLLEHIYASSYYPWTAYFKYDCKLKEGEAAHPDSHEESCPICGADPKKKNQRTSIFGWLFPKWTNDFHYQKAEEPDRHEDITEYDSQGNKHVIRGEDITVREKVDFFNENVRNMLETAQEMDFGEFDVDGMLRDSGRSTNYVNGEYATGEEKNRQQAQILVDAAEKMVGKDGKEIFDKYNSGNSFAWDAAFVSYVADSVGKCSPQDNGMKGKKEDFLDKEKKRYAIPFEKSAKTMAVAFNATNSLIMASTTYVPKPGDLVFVNYNGSMSIEDVQYVGIVTGSRENGLYITAIFGNSGSGSETERKVEKKEISRNHVVAFGTPKYSTSGNLEGADVAEKMWNYFKNNTNYSDAAIAGIMGHAYGESTLDPNVVEAVYGEGFGVMQWSFNRRKAFQQYCRAKNEDEGHVSLETSFEYIIGEMEGVAPTGIEVTRNYLYSGKLDKAYSRYLNGRRIPKSVAEFKACNDPELAAIAMCACYGRPSLQPGKFEKTARIEVRTKAAREYYQRFSGK